MQNKGKNNGILETILQILLALLIVGLVEGCSQKLTPPYFGGEQYSYPPEYIHKHQVIK